MVNPRHFTHFFGLRDENYTLLPVMLIADFRNESLALSLDSRRFFFLLPTRLPEDPYTIMYDAPEFRQSTVRLNADDMGNRKIIMLGSKIYDDGSEGGGLQIRGGANRIHFFGQTIQH